MMNTGYQIFKYDPKIDEAFVSAGLHNWRSDLREAEERKAALERTWSKYGIQYIIVNCAGRGL